MKQNYLIPTTNELTSIFGDLERFANGLFNTSVEKFPFFNLYKQNGTDTLDCIELAVAGFEPSELEVYEDHGLLIVEGNKALESDKVQTHWQAFKGITSRSFKRAFKLNGTTVESVELKNGMLTINLKPTSKEDKKSYDIVAL